MRTTTKSWIALIEKSSNESKGDTWLEPRIKDEHRTIYGMFFPSERYLIDFAEDFHSEGWKQYDTWQDAPYFGVWTNKTLRCILTYAEGDWSLVKCDTDEAYLMEYNEADAFYQREKTVSV